MNKTIELSIKATYLPDWGIKEGVREVVQNAKDGDTEGFAMDIAHLGNVIRIQNRGAKLPHQALLLGHTTKSERENQIGQFGEGLKLGCLALVRSGRKVRIHSGNELWIPAIKKSNNFNEDVLVFDITESKVDCKSIIVDIELSFDEWKGYKKDFLFLNNVKVVEGDCGSIIMSDELAGRIYVKGIFVQQVEKFRYGYNLVGTKVDRDRRMIGNYDLKLGLARLWEDILCQGKCLLEFAEIIENEEYNDMNYIEYHNDAYYVPIETCKFVTERFHKKYGPNTVPVVHESESLELSHVGARCIVTSNKKLVIVIQRVIGTVQDIRKKLASQPIKEYKFHELNSDEKKNFIRACIFVQKAMCIGEEELRESIKIVDFSSSEILGQWTWAEIKIARKILSNFVMTLSTIIHEVAHRHGDDGVKSHVAAIEEGWQKIISSLIEGVK